MLAGPKDVRDAAVALAAQLGMKDVVPTLERMLADTSADETTRVSAFNALSTLTDDVDGLLATGQADASEAIRIASLELLAGRRPEDAVPELSKAIKQGSLNAQQKALSLLGQMKSAAAVAALASGFEALNSGTLPAGATLDLLKAAESAGDPDLKARVEAFRKAQAVDGDKVAAWSECLE